MAPPSGWPRSNMSAGRVIALALCAGAIALGLWLIVVAHGGGVPFIVFGAIIGGSIVFEGRYRGAKSDAAPSGPGWQATGEVFRDDETGRMVQVWCNTQTGERCYVQRDERAP